jgi:membrane associated rhomboid family serine protease
MPYPRRQTSFGSPSFGRVTDGVKWLLISNIALYLICFFLVRSSFAGALTPFTLIPSSVVHSFTIWQLATYLFIHDPFGFGHILINMLTLYMFGSSLEGVWGTRRFLKYYFACGIGAGICVVLLNYALPFGNPNSSVIGASGAIYGLILAFGLIFPEAQILFMFLFPVKAKYFVMIIGAIVFLSSIGSSGGSVSHFAHLGGMVVGLFLLKSSFLKGGSDAWRRGPSLKEQLESVYKEYKFRRAKRKFQVYLKKHGSNSEVDRRIQ